MLKIQCQKHKVHQYFSFEFNFHWWFADFWDLNMQLQHDNDFPNLVLRWNYKWKNFFPREKSFRKYDQKWKQIYNYVFAYFLYITFKFSGCLRVLRLHLGKHPLYILRAGSLIFKYLQQQKYWESYYFICKWLCQFRDISINFKSLIVTYHVLQTIFLFNIFINQVKMIEQYMEKYPLSD